MIEGRAGGRSFERGVDGSECDWGRVLDWESLSRIRLAWMRNPWGILLERYADAAAR